MALHGAGEAAEALDVAGDAFALAEGTRFERAVSALIAPVLEGRNDDLAARCFDNLHPLQGRNLLVGASIASLGPADGMLARIAPDSDTQTTLLYRARSVADSWDSPLWQATTRIALAQRSLGEDPLHEALTIATAYARRATP